VIYCFEFAAIICIHISEESKGILGEKRVIFSQRFSYKIGICSQF